ncbi:MAG TPA: hypothetical protein PLL06_02240, partial [Acidobacteriota bacterium]|nr:hypothetical protein [Acidobacteriota bacterium]
MKSGNSSGNFSKMKNYNDRLAKGKRELSKIWQVAGGGQDGLGFGVQGSGFNKTRSLCSSKNYRDLYLNQSTRDWNTSDSDHWVKPC